MIGMEEKCNGSASDGNYSDMRCLVCAHLVNHPQCLLPPGDLVEEMSDELAHHHTLQLHLVLLHSTPLASKVHCSINGLENSSSPEYSKVQHLLEITVGLFSVGVGLFFVTGGLGKSPPPTKKSPTPTEKSPTLTVKSPTYKKSSSNQKKVLLQRKKVLL